MTARNGLISVIKFVVVEDDLKFQKAIVNVLEKLMFKTKYEYVIEKYPSYNSRLAKTINDCSVRKIYIMDIELEKNSKSGIEIAKEIRRLDWDSEIIFATNHDKMFEVAHRTIFKVFDFIEKFHLLDERLERDIKLILDKNNDYEKFSFVNNKLKMQIYLKDITHIYRDTEERKLIIQTSNNKFIINMTIAEILKELDSRFKQVHRACVVNTERVNMYHWCKGYFILDNNQRVDLCSKLFKEKLNV